MRQSEKGWQYKVITGFLNCKKKENLLTRDFNKTFNPFMTEAVMKVLNDSKNELYYTEYTAIIYLFKVAILLTLNK